jgi:aspartyl-tRNA synthetase
LPQRTHPCGAIDASFVGQTVTLNGWVRRRRDHGNLIFIDLWDRSGLVQVVARPEEAPEAHRVADECRGEFVIAVRGQVFRRPEGMENPRMLTGEIEVHAQEVEILNPSLTPPFPMDESARVDEAIRLEYRYVDLRRPPMQRNLQLRHRVLKALRDFMDAEGFWEVETPCMIRSTPEGARDYVVPDRRFPGKFWALPQSPQLFKQLLQVGGVEKYFQVARCFRDEDLRTDRQPEFTQIDLEMSFVTVDDVLELAERMMAHLFRAATGVELPVPFPRLTYAGAMARYGVDKPDTRFGMELADLSDVFAGSGLRVFQSVLAEGGEIKGIAAPGCAGYSRKEVDDLTELARQFGAGGLISIALDGEGFRSSIQRFLSEAEVAAVKARTGAGPGDLVLIVAARPKVVAAALGRLRLHLGERLGLIDPTAWRPLWVLDFPLFERDEATGKLQPTHHPFSHPKTAEDIALLDTDPERVTGSVYDLVLNGVELGSGSIRCHRTDLQLKILEQIGIPPEEAWRRFGFLLKALQHGAPPHGGIAPGFDRLVALMAGTENIREAIAFPKTAGGTDPMLDAPAELAPEQLAELHLAILPE